MSTQIEADYREYIACLNDRAFDRLDRFVADDVEYNGERVGLDGYRAMLEGNYRDIPDLRFHVRFVVADGSVIASRLDFDCTPTGRFLGMDYRGQRVRFSENVFYDYENGKIRRVWSVLDKAAIEAQLGWKPAPTT